MRVLLTGATGFVAAGLLPRLEQPVVFSRDADRARRSLERFHVTAYSWQPEREPPPAAAWEGVEAVIHLAGESIADGRWTEAKKKRLWDSRVVATSNLVAGLRNLADPPRVLICASASGYYGDRGDQPLTERDPPGDDFLARLCVAWEDAAREAETLGIRVVRPRLGIVLGPGGGALEKLLTIFRSGLASPLGDGRQWMSWIHREDLAELLMFAIAHSEIQGPLNASSPHPVTNREFTRTLAAAVHRPSFMPAVPRFALRLSMGEVADALLASQRMVPAGPESAGFVFRHPQLRGALQDVLGRQPANTG